MLKRKKISSLIIGLSFVDLQNVVLGDLCCICLKLEAYNVCVCVCVGIDLGTDSLNTL